MNLMTYDLIKLAINFYFSAVKNPYLWMTLRDFFFQFVINCYYCYLLYYTTKNKQGKIKYFNSFFFIVS